MLEKFSAIVEMELRRIRHDYTDILTRVVQPLLWLVVFGSVFNRYRIIPTGQYTYMEFIAPGILGQSVLFISIFYGLSLVWDRDSGNLSKLLVAPISRFSIVLGKSMASSVRSLAQAIILFAVIVIIGVHIILNPVFILCSFIAVIMISAVFSSFSILFAGILKTRERFMGFGQLLTMPLFFTSNALYPISMMPEWLQYFAYINPLSYGIDMLRSFLLTGNITNVPLDFLILLCTLLIFTLIGSRVLNRIME